MDVCIPNSNSPITSNLTWFFPDIFLTVISINQVNVNNSTFTWALISRRSVQRAGTRFFARGIDKNVSSLTFPQIEFHTFGFNRIIIFPFQFKYREIVQISLKRNKLLNIWVIKLHLYKFEAVFHCIGRKIQMYATNQHWTSIWPRNIYRQPWNMLKQYSRPTDDIFM